MSGVWFQYTMRSGPNVISRGFCSSVSRQPMVLLLLLVECGVHFQQLRLTARMQVALGVTQLPQKVPCASHAWSTLVGNKPWCSFPCMYSSNSGSQLPVASHGLFVHHSISWRSQAPTVVHVVAASVCEVACCAVLVGWDGWYMKCCCSLGLLSGLPASAAEALECIVCLSLAQQQPPSLADFQNVGRRRVRPWFRVGWAVGLFLLHRYPSQTVGWPCIRRNIDIAAATAVV